MKTGLLTNEKGFALIAAVATLLILSLVGGVVVSLVGKQTFSAVHQTQSLEAFELAEAGAHRALSYLSREGGLCTAITGAGDFTNVALGRGTFTVTATHYNPVNTTLSSAIDDVVTTIPVVSTANFAPHGRIHIEYGAPVLDTVTTATSSSDPMTVPSHPVNSGDDRLLVVAVSEGDEAARSVTSINYGVTPLTLLGTEHHNDDKARIEMWYLINPPVGTADVNVDFSGTPSDGAVVGAMSFTGVHQTTPLGPFVTDEGDGGTVNVDVTSAWNELVIDVIAHRRQDTFTVGAGQTQQWNIMYDQTTGAASTEPGADTPVTMSWSGVADEWVMGGVSLKPLGAEDVNYMNKTGTTFTLAQRGVNGTVADSHPAGTFVSQDLCMIVSTGSVNGPSGPAQRKVEVAVEYP